MKGSQMAWQRKRTITGILFLLPFLAITCVFILYPLYNVIRYSFFEWNGIGKARFVGLDNYRMLPTTEGFWTMAQATLIYAVGVTALVVVAGYLLALALDKTGRFRINRTLMRVMWFFPCLLSGIIVGIIWHIMYNYNSGLINYLLNAIGLESVNWLETYGVTMLAVIVAACGFRWACVPLSFWLACRAFRATCWKRRSWTAQTAGRGKPKLCFPSWRHLSRSM